MWPVIRDYPFNFARIVSFLFLVTFVFYYGDIVDKIRQVRRVYKTQQGKR